MTGTVVEFKTREVPKDYSTLQAKAECYQKVWREWGMHLDPYEQMVALQLIDRTIGWGRREVYCTTRALLDGDSIYAGINASRRKLFYALSALEKKGIIRRRKDTRVPDRVHYTVNMEWSPEVLNLPKRLKTPVHQVHNPVHGVHQVVSDVHPIESINDLVSSSQYQGDAVPAPRSPNPAERVRGIVNQSAAANAEAATKRRAVRVERNTAEGVEHAWRRASAETFPQAAQPAWTGREKGQAKRAASGWSHSRQIAFIDFVEWAVINWTAIGAKQFKWMTKSPPPAVPAFGFFIAMLDQFAECWSEQKLDAWVNDKDRTEIERLMARGQTYEQAVAELGRTRAAVELRGEMTKREVVVRARERSAEMKEQRAEKIAEFGGAAPVHPRSRAAQRMIEEARKPVAPVEDDLPPLAAPMVDTTRNPFDD